MRFLPGLLYPAAIALVLSAGEAARADLVHWSYEWERSPLAVAAGTGGVGFTNEQLAHAVGSSDVVASNLKVFSSAPASNPDQLANNPYTLTLTLTDDASKAFASLKFTGVLNGTFSSASAAVTNTFTGQTTQKVTLGGNTFTVSLSPNGFAPPGPPSSSNVGSLSAHVEVKAGSTGGGSTGTPEPSTMVLAGCGALFLGAARWARRRRKTFAA